MIITATGHRPKDLPCGYSESHSWLIGLKGRLRAFLLEHKTDQVRSGMALGWDMWVAEMCLEVGVQVHAYIPCLSQDSQWPAQSRARYAKIYLDIQNRYGEEAIHIVHNGPYNGPKCMHDRNTAMLDGANCVLALWSGKTYGGTYDTIKKAQEAGIEIVNLYGPAS